MICPLCEGTAYESGFVRLKDGDFTVFFCDRCDEHFTEGEE